MADAFSAQAVFLSYASQDAEAARRLAEALRSAGVEVWFDQNELQGGDAWDAKIRRQIAECALFVPVISAATQARGEGYFRIEWKLAAQRSHAMADDQAFLLPVVIDATRDAEARVPPEFKAVQWTRMPEGQGAEKFCTRVAKLLGAAAVSASLLATTGSTSVPGAAAGVPPNVSARPAKWLPMLAGLALVGVALAVTLVFGLRTSPSMPKSPSAPVAPAVAAQAAPVTDAVPANDKSLVVLPLENLSPDSENAFFTDGMHAEIIATLGRIADLRVVSRGSALAFKNSALPPSAIATKLEVANFIVGSVRRSGNRLRISLELRRSRDEALMWSQTYDRELIDVFAIQSEIATEVARILQVRAAKGTFGGARYTTRNLVAYDLFLKAYAFSEQDIRSLEKQKKAIQLAEDAIRLDPEFATAANLLAHANQRAFSSASDPEDRLRFAAQSKRWGEETARLLPGGAGDGALSIYYAQIELDYTRALQLAENAARALPNDAQSYNYLANANGGLGLVEQALAYNQKARSLDPTGRTYIRNVLGIAARLRRPSLYDATLRLYTPEELSAPINSLAAWIFMQSGELPADLSQMSALQKAVWLKRSRQWPALLALVEEGLASQPNPVERLEYLGLQIEALRALGREADTLSPISSALETAKSLQSIAEVGPPQKFGWLASALVWAGRGVEARDAINRFVDATTEQQVNIRFQRLIRKAELLASLRDTDAALALIAQLLREPSGLTVPMLRVDPAWDKLRTDPRFNALLADPANSAPL